MSQPRTIAFTSVGQGPLAWKPRPSEFGPQCVLFRSRAAWEARADGFATNPATTSAGDSARLAKLDFTRASVLAVTLGEAGSTGISIRLERIEAGPPPVLVMTGTYPGAGEMTGAMMTHPFHLVILEATALPADAVFTLDGRKIEVERHVFE